MDIESLPAQSDYVDIHNEALSDIEYEPNQEEHPEATPDEEASVTHVSGQIAFYVLFLLEIIRVFPKVTRVESSDSFQWQITLENGRSASASNFWKT